ncbi:hypothetical protein ABZZ44_00870 [Streptomyces sp. NPDC006460]|uniref:hypothetical protein n=1 Tax=Streptomyces sp. NPDC006460 TaxID=3154304 RepID=UPI0033B10A0B
MSDAPTVPALTVRSARRHRAPRLPAPEAARRRLAAALLGAGALAATFLTVAVDPAAPPAPDREQQVTTSDAARLSRD